MGIEPDPEQARVAEHDQEGVAPSPGEVELGEVHLGLVARGRLEADEGRLRWARADLADVAADAGVAAGVAGHRNLLEEAHGRELRVGGEAGIDEGLVRVEFMSSGRARLVAGQRVEVALELAVGDPASDGPLADGEAVGKGSVGEPLFEVVFEEHTGFESDHGRLRSDDEEGPSWEIGRTYAG